MLLILDAEIDEWKPEDGTNIWEHSGLFEGDIMLYSKQSIKNGLIDETYRWPNATIPYYIDDAFSKCLKYHKIRKKCLKCNSDNYFCHLFHQLLTK